jgi:phage protein D
VTDRPVFTEAQAREMAKDIIRKQLEGMVQASGATVGLPDLRAGRKVQISGLGPRFQGEYFISESTHTIDESGYRTRFTAKRNVPTQ